MDIKHYLANITSDERQAFAKAIGTSVVYLSHLSSGYRMPSPKRALAMVAYDPRLTLQELRPDVWGEALSPALSE